MSKDYEIQRGLRMAGTPDYVDTTTLLKEGAVELRGMVSGGVLAKPKSSVGLYLYPAKPSAYSRARTLFYLVAKELFLSGSTVYCIPLSRLYDSLHSDDITPESTMLSQARFIFVTDFYEEGAPCPLQPHEASRVRAWIREKYEKGGAVSLLSDKPPEACTLWWPTAFIGFLTSHTIVRGEK